jgi:hypothetical protein
MSMMSAIPIDLQCVLSDLIEALRSVAKRCLGLRCQPLLNIVYRPEQNSIVAGERPEAVCRPEFHCVFVNGVHEYGSARQETCARNRAFQRIMQQSGAQSAASEFAIDGELADEDCGKLRGWLTGSNAPRKDRRIDRSWG